MKQKIKKYIIINNTFLGINIYIILLPIISPIMQRILPNLWQCAYLAHTGKPCPFCGITRDFSSIISLEFDLINPISIFIFAFVILGLIIGIFLSFYFRRIDT